MNVGIVVGLVGGIKVQMNFATVTLVGDDDKMKVRMKVEMNIEI